MSHIEEFIKKLYSNQKDQIYVQDIYRNELNEEVTQVKQLAKSSCLLIKDFTQGKTFEEIYQTLRDIVKSLRSSDTSNKLYGIIWAESYKQIEQQRRNSFLEYLIDERNFGFWLAIHSLEHFCDRIELQAEFAANWFYKLSVRVEGDWAGGLFYRGVEKYAERHVESAHKILIELKKKSIDNFKVNLIAIILGKLRYHSSQGKFSKKKLKDIEDYFVKSPQVMQRLCYYRSIISSFAEGTIDTQRLGQELDSMLKGEGEEISEAFFVIYKTVINNKAKKDVVIFALNWCREHTNANLTDNAKYYAAQTAHYSLDPQFGNIGKEYNHIANEILEKIQPVQKELKGIWEEIEYYLVQRLGEGANYFEESIISILKSGSDALINQFATYRNWLFDEIKKNKAVFLVTKWFISKKWELRQLAKTIIRCSDITFDSEILEKANADELEVFILTIISEPLLEKNASGIFLSALPAFEKTSEVNVKELFKDEMYFYAINYPGRCLQEWKQQQKPSDLLKEVITKAENYFTNLKPLYELPANNFSFPEYQTISQEAGTSFSNKIREEATKESVFLNLVKQTDVIYGNKWATMINGRLGGETGFNQLGQTFEMPRMELIDPEGLKYKRFWASIELQKLEEKN